MLSGVEGNLRRIPGRQVRSPGVVCVVGLVHVGVQLLLLAHVVITVNGLVLRGRRRRQPPLLGLLDEPMLAVGAALGGRGFPSSGRRNGDSLGRRRAIMLPLLLAVAVDLLARRWGQCWSRWRRVRRPALSGSGRWRRRWCRLTDDLGC